MNLTPSGRHPLGQPFGPWHFHFRTRICQTLILCLLFGFLSARAEKGDEEYVAIFNLIQDADALKANGKTSAALAKYQTAQTALLNFRSVYPDADVKAVAFRLAYVSEKLAPPEENAAPAAPAVQVEAEPGAPSLSGPSVKLIDAGAEPRKALRLHPKAGDHQTLAMTIKMDMGIKMGQMQNQSMKIPAIKTTMDVDIKEVSDTGDITYESTTGTFEVAEESGGAPEIAQAMKASLSGLNGLKGGGTLSNRGFSKDSKIEIPASANPQMRQAMDQMKESLGMIAALLPEEAVGPGAKWQVKMPIKSQGMTIEQTANYELVSLQGEKMTARSTIDQRAANQKITNPATPTVKVNLIKMDGHGKGALTLDLGQLLPAEASLESQSDISMAMDLGGQKQNMTMNMAMNLQIGSK
jgi:hypothetical protein